MVSCYTSGWGISLNKALFENGRSTIRAWGLLYHVFDFHAGDARNCFTSCYTTSNLQFSHQIWNVSHKNYSCAFTTSFHVSHFTVYTEITKITSSIDAKTEPHEGRNMVSVDLSAQVQTGCVVTKGTKLCLESVGLSVLQ